MRMKVSAEGRGVVAAEVGGEGSRAGSGAFWSRQGQRQWRLDCMGFDLGWSQDLPLREHLSGDWRDGQGKPESAPEFALEAGRLAVQEQAYDETNGEDG